MIPMPMNRRYNEAAPRKATNLTVNSDLLAQAKELGINLSAVLERSLAEEVKKRRAELWLQQNREAIAEYNAEILKSGTFSDGLRSF